jgi:hypothetical protein
MNRSIFSSIILTAIAAIAVPQQASAAFFAAKTAVSTISPCPSYCGGPGAIFEYDIDGGVGVGSSQSLVPAGVNGTGASAAHLNGGGLALPTLGADAFSEADSRVSANGAAMNSYTYSGAPSTFTMLTTLHGHVTNGTHAYDGNLSSNLEVVMANDLDFASDFGTFHYEIVPLTPGATSLGTSSINFRALNLVDSGPQSVTDSLTFTLEDGDMIFIWSNLLATGTRSGVAVGGHTFTAEFTAGNVDGLTPSYVPVPAAVYLFGSGVVLLGGLMRRNKDKIDSVS